MRQYYSEFYCGCRYIQPIADGAEAGDELLPRLRYCPLHQAAPDLLAACEAAVEWLDRFCADAPIVFGGEALLGIQLQDAIAKAKGEADDTP